VQTNTSAARRSNCRSAICRTAPSRRTTWRRRRSRRSAPTVLRRRRRRTDRQVHEADGRVHREEFDASFEAQIQGLVEGGVDLISIETMYSLEEALSALRAARRISICGVRPHDLRQEPARLLHALMGRRWPTPGGLEDNGATSSAATARTAAPCSSSWPVSCGTAPISRDRAAEPGQADARKESRCTSRRSRSS